MNQNLYHMEGECYKRPHYPDQPEELRQWLERRNLSFTAESEDMDLLFSPALADKLSEDFEKLSPIYHFCWKLRSQNCKIIAAGTNGYKNAFYNARITCTIHLVSFEFRLRNSGITSREVGHEL